MPSSCARSACVRVLSPSIWGAPGPKIPTASRVKTVESMFQSCVSTARLKRLSVCSISAITRELVFSVGRLPASESGMRKRRCAILNMSSGCDQASQRVVLDMNAAVNIETHSGCCCCLCMRSIVLRNMFQLLSPKGWDRQSRIGCDRRCSRQERESSLLENTPIHGTLQQSCGGRRLKLGSAVADSLSNKDSTPIKYQHNELPVTTEAIDIIRALLYAS